MVKVLSYTLNPNDMTAKASLFADDKTEVTDSMEIIGLPKGYTLDSGSSCLTADKDFAFLDSEGSWHW